MQDVNPYQPPNSHAAEPVFGESPRFFASLIPATLALGLTLFAWFVLISSFSRVIPSRFSIPFWSASLFFASSMSILVITRVWRVTTHPLAFAGVFTVFCIVFVVAEGDTSNGASYWNMATVYGTLMTLPLAVYFLTRHTGLIRGRSLRLPTGGQACDQPKPQ